MIRQLALLGMAITTLLLVGCEPPAASSAAVTSAPPGPPPPSAPPAPPPLNAATTQPDISAPAEAEIPTETANNAAPPIDSPNPAPAAPPASSVAALTSEPTPSRSPTVRLSAGVALPQLLPEGTQVGVSVDYVLGGTPQTSCKYVLVIESSAGEVGLPVQLEPRGTFQAFLPAEVRPEHKPFHARIDEVPPGGKPIQISNSAVLATSY